MTDPLSADQLFISKLTAIVLDKLSDENFDVGKLSREAGMSRSSVHRRLQKLMNQNASQFIREIRLKRAMEMLQLGMGTASEIAYKVGFGSPTYFSKCFHEFYGYPPGEVKISVLPDDEGTFESSLANMTDPGQTLSIKKEEPVPGIKKRRKSVILVFGAAIIFLALAWGLNSYLVNGQFQFRVFPTHSRDLSIVVLPFKNFSDDPANQYFADGIMEDILNNLYQISELRVISRTTSEHFGAAGLTAGDIARKVNARNVLEGSVRRYGDEIRISVQLIDAYRDHHLWSANFDRKITDIIGIQGDIAMQVANKLNAVITDNEVRQIEDIPTQDPEAYDNYLRGRFLLHKANSEQRFDIDREGLMGSIQYFEKAIAADDNFAEAYAGLANAWFNLSAWGWYQPYYEGIQKAKDFSAEALKIDPDCAEAHAITGGYLVWPERSFEEGRKELLKAIQLNPNFSTAYQWYAQLLMITGPIEEARVYMDRGLQLEPYFWVMQNLSVWIYYFEGKNDKAIEACLIARDLKPDFIENQWLFFLNYAKLGEGEKAVQELQTIAGRYPGAGQFAGEISDAYQKSGIKGLFSWLVDVNMHNPIPVEGMTGHPFFIAWWNAILGNTDESVYWLEKNLEHPSPLYLYFNLITTNPDFDIMRDDPRFLAIIDELGLAPYNTRVPK
ncbi:MAG TPA: helix-turn-helix domain-containing protein [Bacteroidales bacterium]|nr:helix-turn-helix domain-containing protein [Bacteroidales bacterium]